MRSTVQRTALVRKRARQLRLARERIHIRVLSLMSAMLSLSLVILFGMEDMYSTPDVTGVYGTVLLHENVGGYVLVGIVCFTAAVIFTLLCVQWRDRDSEDRKQDSDAKKTRIDSEI